MKIKYLPIIRERRGKKQRKITRIFKNTASVVGYVGYILK